MQTIKQIERDALLLWHSYPKYLRLTLTPLRLESGNDYLAIEGDSFEYVEHFRSGKTENGVVTWTDEVETLGGRWEQVEHQGWDNCRSNCECYKLKSKELTLHISWDFVQLWKYWDDDIPAMFSIVSPLLVAKLLRALGLAPLPRLSRERARLRIAQCKEIQAQNGISWSMTK